MCTVLDGPVPHQGASSDIAPRHCRRQLLPEQNFCLRSRASILTRTVSSCPATGLSNGISACVLIDWCAQALYSSPTFSGMSWMRIAPCSWAPTLPMIWHAYAPNLTMPDSTKSYSQTQSGVTKPAEPYRGAFCFRPVISSARPRSGIRSQRMASSSGLTTQEPTSNQPH